MANDDSETVELRESLYHLFVEFRPELGQDSLGTRCVGVKALPGIQIKSLRLFCRYLFFTAPSQWNETFERNQRQIRLLQSIGDYILRNIACSALNVTSVQSTIHPSITEHRLFIFLKDSSTYEYFT
jgi:hypothetical protein